MASAIQYNPLKMIKYRSDTTYEKIPTLGTYYVVLILIFLEKLRNLKKAPKSINSKFLSVRS